MKYRFTKLLCLLLFIAGIARAEEQRIVELSTINWEPYTGEFLPENGLLSELVSAAFAKVDYQVRYYYRPWKRALQEAQQGKWDGIMDIYYTKERSDWFSFSEVLWQVKETFVYMGEKTFPYDGQLDQLKNYSIGIDAGSTQGQELIKNGLNTVASPNHHNNVRKLLRGRVDLILIPSSVFLYYLTRVNSRFHLQQIHMLKPAYKTFDVYVAFSKKNPQYQILTQKFNRGLAKLKADGDYLRIVKKHQMILD